MPIRRVRLALAGTATAVAVGGVLIFAAGAPAETTGTAAVRPAAPASSATPSARPSTSAPAARLGSPLFVTSPPPEPSATPVETAPADGIHVDCAKGDDGNKGTLTAPLRSVRAAVAAHAGEVIELARGCVWRTSVQLRGDGTVLTSYGQGALPVIDGSATGAESVVVLSGKRQRVENVRVTGAETNAVEIQGDGSVIRASTIDHAGVGVLLKATGAAADGVAVRDLHMVVDTPGGDDDFGAIGFSVQASDVTIGNSSCSDCRAPSHDYGYDGGFVEVWNYADNLDIHDNTGVNIQGILEIGADRADSSARGIRLRDNTFRNAHGGVNLHTAGTFAIADARIAVTGNTITSTGAQDPPILDGDLSRVTFVGNTVSTASFVSHSEPSEHRCNGITLYGAAELGYQRDSSERMGGRARCS